ncbi:Histidinol-phosphate aminotransferase [Luteitalea pratensis]|uniref:histidinol-phosphate transaminase n=1 Tax=Luteitalea pratensis TaxID=1855912 RepID=A0A143PX62_LUTPR|nr:histidinol-phosphate transaminase [Luteitalea pratensis]AMY12808.1 Histidinol-phosphate aminotransferase [Luteitalea pratensis]
MTTARAGDRAGTSGSMERPGTVAPAGANQYEYDRADAPADALRLHLNEHTGGCSAAVTEAVARVTRETVAKYPDYTAVTRAVADHLDVPTSRVLLTNGLDEGIFAVAIAQLRPPGVAAGLVRQPARGTSPAPAPVSASGTGRKSRIVAGSLQPVACGLNEALILEPAFGMYADAVEAVGGTVVRVMPGAGLSLDREAIAAAVTPLTGALFVASPGNPSGISLTLAEITWLASLLPAGALLLLDEAYVEFGGESFIPHLDRWSNVVVGRTFAKAYGLAGMRVGAVVAREDVITRLRRVLPPYSLNVFVVAALEAALGDRAYMDDYRAQVAESKRLLYDACERWGLPCVRSDANFVLVRAGDKRQALLDGLQARNIYIRDRDRQPGCEGCVRVTTGLVTHTTTCIAAMEEILCARA